ncbi:MAG: hypothetical protein MUO76_19790 [Anaerolineaceae bacterium]|nr:hypothetical protein [Anaerolineaceae bacterium]
MFETIKKVIHLLSEEGQTVEYIASSLGTLRDTYEAGLPTIVLPFDDFFREVQVVPEFDTDVPAHVILELAEPGSVTMKELKAAFGKYSVFPAMHWNRPANAIFEVDPGEGDFTYTLLVDVQEGTRGVKNGTVTSLTVQRDIRLE